jgi:hypothetical protein
MENLCSTQICVGHKDAHRKLAEYVAKPNMKEDKLTKSRDLDYHEPFLVRFIGSDNSDDKEHQPQNRSVRAKANIITTHSS